jgi:hypothetical protein
MQTGTRAAADHSREQKKTEVSTLSYLSFKMHRICCIILGETIILVCCYNQRLGRLALSCACSHSVLQSSSL